MFGLKNYRGSCWVNACLQGIFMIPEVRKRYMTNAHDEENLIDKCLSIIFKSKGEDGLKQLFEVVKAKHINPGNDIGDSHELLMFLCDKLPFLDELCRFKVGNSMHCKKCNKTEITESSVSEYSLTDVKNGEMLTETILRSVQPFQNDEWRCSLTADPSDDEVVEVCKGTSGTTQLLIGSYPKVMIFHIFPVNLTINYSSILILNKKEYALTSVICYNGSHWWTYGRDMPPGTDWYILDDLRVVKHGPKQFPVSSNMRILIYYRLEN
jgi:ubiquitin C-terminal hydrolase